jgi:rhomboid family GlyGly-CTERM serine protease
MDDSKPPALGRRIPFLTLLLIGGAVAAALFPRCAPWLVYDRTAILSGEVWRMFTGHWVHFSLRHLVYDVAPLGLAGWIIETRGLRGFGWFCALAPWAISAALLVFEPQMRFCGGLSGLATGALVFLALGGLSDPPPWRRVCGAVLLALAGKTLFELAAGRTVLDTLAGLPVVVSVTSHIAGAATALVLCALVLYTSPNAHEGTRLTGEAGPVGEEGLAGEEGSVGRPQELHGHTMGVSIGL